MKSQGFKPAIFIRKGGELSLSGPTLTELFQGMLDKGASFKFRAKGFSMSPFIKDGDVVTVLPLPGASSRLGDVLVFIHPGTGKLVVHRVVGKKGTSYLIKGDSTPEVDALVPKENILGCVRKVEREGKKVFLGLGPERFLIAFLVRRGLLFPLLVPLWRLVRLIVRRSAK